MNKPAHILVVDDEPGIRELLQTYLTQQGFNTHAVADGISLRKAMSTLSIDLVIVDLILPGEDGLSLTRYLREHWDVAIIILTGKGDTIDRIVGLEIGADDYIAKPFDLRELLARIKSVLRRVKSPGSKKDPTSAKTLCFAGWQLNLTSRLLVSPQGKEVSLTTGEFDLLSVLAQHPNRVLSRDVLLDFTRNREAVPFDRSIDVQIGRLRRKIEEDPEHPLIIKTVRGAGYVFTQTIEDKN
jgi:two-component system OmpR family response regulator